MIDLDRTIRPSLSLAGAWLFFILSGYLSAAAESPGAPDEDSVSIVPIAGEGVAAGYSSASQSSSDILVVESLNDVLTHIEQAELFEQRLKNYQVTDADAVVLFNSLRDATRLRLWQFDMALENAISTSDPAIINPTEIERQHPGFPKSMYKLPPNVKTIRDLYSNVEDLFWARNRVLQFLPPADRQRVKGTACLLYTSPSPRD